MFGLINRYRERRRLLKAAQRAVVNDRTGYAAHAWAVHSGLSGSDKEALADHVRAWLMTQISNTATPYGFSDYSVAIGLARVEDGKRIVLAYDELPPFNRQELGASLNQIVAYIADMPLDGHPDATRLEVVFLSLGDALLKAAKEVGYD